MCVARRLLQQVRHRDQLPGCTVQPLATAVRGSSQTQPGLAGVVCMPLCSQLGVF
jgi:hypothetical protein